MTNAVLCFSLLFFLCSEFAFRVKAKSTMKFINSKQTRRKKNRSIALSNVSRIFGRKTKFLIQQILINQYRYQDFRFRFIRFCCLSYSKQASLSLFVLSFPFQNCLTKLEDKVLFGKYAEEIF